MTKKMKESIRDSEIEYEMIGLRIKKTIKKGTWCITIKLMYCQSVNENVYCIPSMSKEIKIPIQDVYIPIDNDELTRENYLVCRMNNKVIGGSQVFKTYTIADDCLEILRKDMTNDL